MISRESEKICVDCAALCDSIECAYSYATLCARRLSCLYNCRASACNNTENPLSFALVLQTIISSMIMIMNIPMNKNNNNDNDNGVMFYVEVHVSF